MRAAIAIAAVLLCLAPLPAFTEGSASRLPDLPDPPTDPVLKKDFEATKASGGAVINIQLTLGHAPKYMQAIGQVARTIRNEGVSPRLLRELAILRSAYLVGSEYEFAHHLALAKACNYPAAKLDGVSKWPQSASVFDERERAMLAYIEQMTHGGDVDDATFEQFASLFTPEEIVEISVAVSIYYGGGLLTKALRIKLEAGGQETYLGKC
ncbi:MAG: carboxymuconolactone decarboxylase family protein [Acetobacteraceae bacterium]|nr:carboxymuconolactone decarboxylase family protein [Acetobacteraceae bacterium]